MRSGSGFKAGRKSESKSILAQQQLYHAPALHCTCRYYLSIRLSRYCAECSSALHWILLKGELWLLLQANNVKSTYCETTTNWKSENFMDILFRKLKASMSLLYSMLLNLLVWTSTALNWTVSWLHTAITSIIRARHVWRMMQWPSSRNHVEMRRPARAVQQKMCMSTRRYPAHSSMSYCHAPPDSWILV